MDLKIITLFLIFVFLGCYLGKKVEQFCGVVPDDGGHYSGGTGCPNWCSCESNGQDCTACDAQPNAAGAGKCVPNTCGSNNSVTGDCSASKAPKSKMGTERLYKYPHYYGMGTGSGFSYGEPYYVRTVQY